MSVQMTTDRFTLRELSEDDVKDRYLSWLSGLEARRFISAAAETKSLDELKRYVRVRMGRNDILFLGIFTKETGLHIGNVKYEPVNSRLGYAIMGILIGDPVYRGIGVTREVISASARWLHHHRGVQQIVLGVGKNNSAAIRAYEKAGFVEAESEFIPDVLPENTTMVLDLRGTR